MKPMLANPLWRALHVFYTSVQWYDQSAVWPAHENRGAAMSLRVPMASIAEDPMVIARAEAAVAAAADHLKGPPPELTPAALAHQLDSLRQRLEQRISLPSDPAMGGAMSTKILVTVMWLQCEAD